MDYQELRMLAAQDQVAVQAYLLLPVFLLP
jgi:hypothetical protein